MTMTCWACCELAMAAAILTAISPQPIIPIRSRSIETPPEGDKVMGAGSWVMHDWCRLSASRLLDCSTPRLSYHPRSPVNVIPSMNVFWVKKKRIAIGARTTTLAAMNPGQLTKCWEKKLKRPSCNVYLSGFER